MISSQEELQKLSDKAAAHVLSMEGTQTGTRTGWLMITTILIEARDLYSISFLLVFIKNEFKPDAALLGLASASVQLCAVVVPRTSQSLKNICFISKGRTGKQNA
jgi:hypothetical protein